MTGMSAITGKRLTLRDHIRQSVRDILTTPIGSRIMRRGYGSYLFELIDQPLHGATLLRAYAATAEAIIRWEPRITLQNVLLSSTTAGELVIDIDFSENSSTSERVSVPLGLKGVTAP